MENLLQDIGLTQYESKVYIALLDLGEASSGEILDKAEIHTGKIYQIVESLKNKGFAGEVKKNGVRKFFATDPQRIQQFLDAKIGTIREQQTQFTQLLPNILAKIGTNKTKTHIEIFTGWNGLKHAFEKESSRYTDNSELCISGILPYEYHNKKIVDYFKYNVFTKRNDAKIIIRKIVHNESNNPIEKNVTVKKVNYNSILTFNVIKDLTIISIWLDEPIFITIESTEVAKGFQENFELLWRIAK